MSNNFFSPNQKINGGAMFASWNSKDGSVYFKILKQIALNEDKRGNFDGKNPIFVKLTQDEAAGFIRAVNNNSNMSFYHTFDNDVTTGSFKYYEVDAKDKNGKIFKKYGFGLTIKRNDNEIKVGFTLDSAQRLSLFLQNALRHIFDAEYAQDIKDAQEYSKKKKETSKTLKSEYVPEESEKSESEKKENKEGEDFSNLDEEF